ncbi:MAG: TetR/AcrR family transcriptional regulator C-terminal domain-containing protein [Nocardioidaceae bacterium]
MARALAALDALGCSTCPSPTWPPTSSSGWWLGGPLNRLSLHAGARRPSTRRLQAVAEEAVETFLCRYGRPSAR